MPLIFLALPTDCSTGDSVIENRSLTTQDVSKIPGCPDNVPNCEQRIVIQVELKSYKTEEGEGIFIGGLMKIL